MTNQLDVQNFWSSQIFVKMLFYMWIFKNCFHGFSFLDFTFNLEWVVLWFWNFTPKIYLCAPPPTTTKLCYIQKQFHRFTFYLQYPPYTCQSWSVDKECFKRCNKHNMMQYAITICNMQYAICNMQYAICNMQCAICNMQCAILNM